MQLPMTEVQIAELWTRFTLATKEAGPSSQRAVAALHEVSSNAPQPGCTAAARAAWRRVAEALAAHAVVSYQLSATTADLARMILHQNAVAEAAEHVSTTALMN